MSKEPVVLLPLIVKIAVALTFFNSWVMFEEFVIDRWGLWQYLPLYKVGVFCAWDALAMLVIIPTVWYAFRKWRVSRAAASKRFCFLKRCVLCA